jgi:hypothetical protein
LLSRGEEMRTLPILGVLLLVGIGIVRPALGDARKGQSGQPRWWGGEWQEEFWGGPCEVKLESKRDEYKEEVTCERGR